MFFLSASSPLRDRARAFSSMGWALCFFAAAVLLPAPAWAAGESATTLGDIICNIKNNLGSYPYILNVAAYIMGCFMGVRSILLFKRHGENPAQPQVTAAVAHLLGAAFLLMLPAVAGLLQRSFFGKAGGAGDYGCVGKPPEGSSGSIGFDQMMTNFVGNIYKPFFVLLSLISVAAGLTFIVSALLRGAKTGTDPKAADPKGIIVNLVIGAIMISIGTVLPSVLTSIFGKGDVSSMTSVKLVQWSKIAGSGFNTDAADKALQAVLAFVQIIGAMSFVRGWLIVKKAVEGGGQATVPQGFAHIIGGAMAINIDVMIRAIDKTFGTQITTSA